MASKNRSGSPLIRAIHNSVDNVGRHISRLNFKAF